MEEEGSNYSNESFEVHGDKYLLNTVNWEELCLEMTSN